MGVRLLLAVLLFSCMSISVRAQDVPDALALRVIPNPNNYSAFRWYNQQGFAGSPQSVIVDGYEGVRDGRTVYVNAANVSYASGSTTLYTNIYLISYNQNSQEDTVDIFGQLLKHWRFNSNITAVGKCTRGNDCMVDSECPVNEFCYGFKAGVTRDVRRLADLADIKTALESYKSNKGKGRYPQLGAGTYLKGASLSVWPSWKDSFEKELGITMPLDPINNAGTCGSPAFDPKTCWDEKAKAFAFDLSGSGFSYDSSLYYYESRASGTTYYICAAMDTSLTGSRCPKTGSMSCPDSDGDGYDCGDNGQPADCDDGNAAVHPFAPELCNNIDDDCNGSRDETFSLDDCSYRCTLSGFSYDGGRIGNQRCCGNDLGEGAEAGRCNDGFDNDCDGLIDYADPDCPLVCTDNDGDYHIAENQPQFALCPSICGPTHNQPCTGYNDCNDNDNTVRFGFIDVCDGVDNDCNTIIDDGFNEETCSYVCLALNPSYDYNAFLPYRAGSSRVCCGDDANEGGPYQPTESSCGDGRDNDCDNAIDMADTDCNGSCGFVDERNWVNLATPGDCNQCDVEGSQASLDGQDGEDWSPYPGMADRCDVACGFVAATVPLARFESGNELTCDGIDNDCDGTIDEGCDDDGDDYCDSAMRVSVPRGATCPNTTVASGSFGDDCNDANPSVNPLADEQCDNLDNNCDGLTDRDTSNNPLTRNCYTGIPASTNGIGACNGGSQNCAAGAWGSCVGQVVPGMEVCNGLDDDCDNLVDENMGNTTCGQGTCVNTVANCVAGASQTCNPYLGALPSENCSVAGDNDCDGQSDATDSDCAPQNYYCDNDTDGHWTTVPVSCIGVGCTPVGCNGYRLAIGDDCNDSNADIHFDAQNESVMGFCGDGLDNNCNTTVDDGCPMDDCYRDADGDFHYSMTPYMQVLATNNCPTGSVKAMGDDCNDTVLTGFSIHPGATDLCNGIDENCNGMADDGSGEAAPLNANQTGVCAGSQRSCLGGIWQNHYLSIPFYEVVETSCGDTRDNDCAGDGDCVCDNDGFPEIALGENCLNCPSDVLDCGATAGSCGVYFSGLEVASQNNVAYYRSRYPNGSYSRFIGVGRYKVTDLPYHNIAIPTYFEGFAVDNNTVIRFWTNDNYTGAQYLVNGPAIVNACRVKTNGNGCVGLYQAPNCFGYGLPGSGYWDDCREDLSILNYQSFEITCN